jgi:hypothetical protein
MSEEKQVQSAPAEEQPKQAQEVATDSQDQPAQSNVGELIAESKKYRARSQKDREKIAELEKQIEDSRQKQLEEQEEWKTLAEERANKISELEPIVEMAKKQEADLRQKLLGDFDEDDRETFGDLPLDKLQAVHGKIINTTARVNVANNPAVPVNELTDEYKDISDKDRQKHWQKIIAGYQKRAVS